RVNSFKRVPSASRPLGGRPWIAKAVRDLIRRMSFENPLWGAPHIHGELLKLGFELALSTVSRPAASPIFYGLDTSGGGHLRLVSGERLPQRSLKDRRHFALEVDLVPARVDSGD